MVKFGEDFLITYEDTDSYIIDVNEKFNHRVNATVLKSNQYCKIENFQDENGVTHFGEKKLVRGETSFFLKPGESFDVVRNAYLLSDNDGLILQALAEFEDTCNESGTRIVSFRPDLLFVMLLYVQCIIINNIHSLL